MDTLQVPIEVAVPDRVETMVVELGYRGGAYSGFAEQKDPAIRTVAGELRHALELILRREVELTCAGRTDAGVHALAQYVSLPVYGDECDREGRRIVHALENREDLLAHVFFGQIVVFQYEADVREAAAHMSAADVLVGHAQTLVHVHHVMPSIERYLPTAARHARRLLGRFLAIAVERLVKIHDGLRLTERFGQEWIIGPSRTGYLAHADIAPIQEILSIQCRPD